MADEGEEEEVPVEKTPLQLALEEIDKVWDEQIEAKRKELEEEQSKLEGLATEFTRALEPIKEKDTKLRSADPPSAARDLVEIGEKINRLQAQHVVERDFLKLSIGTLRLELGVSDVLCLPSLLSAPPATALYCAPTLCTRFAGQIPRLF